MTRDPNDDALRWGGDDATTLAPGWTTAARRYPRGYAWRGEPKDDSTATLDDDARAEASDDDGDRTTQP